MCECRTNATYESVYEVSCFGTRFVLQIICTSCVHTIYGFVCSGVIYFFRFYWNSINFVCFSAAFVAFFFTLYARQQTNSYCFVMVFLLCMLKIKALYTILFIGSTLTQLKLENDSFSALCECDE